MAPITRRLAHRIERDFPHGDAHELAVLVARAAQSERVQAAIVLGAGGDPLHLRQQAKLAQIDWRDVLVNAGLAHDDWPAVLDQQLGR